MSVTSADPDDLGTFVDSSDSLTNRFDSRITRLQNRERTVAAACSYNHPSTPSIPAARTLHGNWIDNGDFVRTVRDDLLEADSYDARGLPTVADRNVEQSLTAAGLTTAPGVVEISPVEMLGDPPYSGFVDDPICLANGNFILEEEDLPLFGLAEPLSVRRTYNSRDDRDGLFGLRWTSLLDASLTITHHHVLLRGPDGGGFVFRRRADGRWTEDLRRRRRLLENEDGWTIEEAHERRFHFDADGVLIGHDTGPSRVRINRQDGSIDIVEEISGRSVRHHLDPEGRRITSSVSSDGRRVTYHHDEAGHLVLVERDAGDLAYEIDEDGFLAAATDADGVLVFRNTYDPDGWVLSQIESHGRETRYEYRPDGVSTVTSPDGRPPNVMVHDRRGRLTAMIDGLGNVMRMSYDDRDHLTQIVDRTGAVIRFRHDEHGNLVERTDPDGLTVRYEWDELGRLVRQINRAGAVYTHSYEGERRDPRRIELPDGSSLRFEHDEHGLVRTVVDADDIALTLVRGDDGSVTSVLDADGRPVLDVEHDDAGRVIASEIDGRRFETEIDAAGRILRYTDPDGTEFHDHSPAGRLTAISRDGGNRWRYERDHTGEIIALADDRGVYTRYERDGVGDVVAEIDAEGGRTVYERDPLGRITAIIDPIGNRTEHLYDAEGRIVGIVDPAGNRYRRERDVIGRIIADVDPSGTRTEFTYHPNGELATQTDAAGNTWHREIDPLGRTRRVIEPDGTEIGLRYSSTGKLLEHRTPEGRIARKRYDHLGRLTAIVAPDGTEHAVESDDPPPSIGELPESFAIDAERVSFDHDLRGFLREVVDPAGVATSFLHDATGRVTATRTGSIGMAFGWDAAGGLSSLVDPHGHITEFHRDASGAIGAIDHPDGTRIRIERDVDGYLRHITDDAGSVDLEIHRDVLGQVERVVDAHGEVRIERDVVGVLRSLTNATGGITYRADADDLLVEVTDPNHRITFERDVNARVTGIRLDDGPTVDTPGDDEAVRDEHGRITVDAAGRRHTYDLAGRLASTTVDDRTTTFEYDDLGLLATEHGPDGIRTHHHGPAGEILRLRETDGSETTYLHDLRGRRIADQHADGSQRSYQWDGLGRLVGFTDTDASGRQRERMIERDQLGRPMRVDGSVILWLDPAGIDLHGIDDERFAHAGVHVRSLTDPNDTWSRRVGDDPWGHDGGRGVRMGHRGHLAVDDLVLMGTRVYDSVTRTFLSRDPLPSVPGQLAFVGLYQYAGNDPVNNLDPTGRRPLSDAEFADWKEENSKGWLRKQWEDIDWTSVAIAVGATILTTALIVTTGGSALLIGAAVGAAAGALDAGLHGGDGGDIALAAVTGGVLGLAGGGLGRVFQGFSRAPAGSVRNFIGSRPALANGINSYGGAYAGEGVNYGIDRLRGDPNASFNVISPLITGTADMGGGMIGDRLRPASATDTDANAVSNTDTQPPSPPDPGPTAPADGPSAPRSPSGSPDAGTVEGLQGVPQIGDVLANRVSNYRAAQGGAPLTYEQLLQIDQIGPVRAQAIIDAGMN